MGREIKRVPLDFDWPLRNVWPGFVNPYYENMHTCPECGRGNDDCERCGGEGEIWDAPEHKALYEAWEPTEPPTGEGWQLWETVSEGAPISPVLPTREAFIDYLVAQGYTLQVSQRFTEKGFTPSAAYVNGRFLLGIEAFDELPAAADTDTETDE